MRSLALASVTAVALSACGAGGGGTRSAIPAATSNQGPSQYTGPAALTYSWNEAVVKKAQYVGPLTGDGNLTVHVGLRMRNERALLQYAQDASNPKSPSYRHFLSPQDIGSRFGASADDVKAISKYFHANGASFTTWPQHLTGIVHGKRSAMEKAFGVTFGIYKMHGVPFVGPSGGSPHFAQAIPVASAMLAANYTPAKTYNIRLGDGNFVGYSPQQIARGFDYSGAWGAGLTGTGITIGIIGTGPIDLGNNTAQAVQPNNGGDVGKYQKTYGEISQFGLPATGSSIAIVAASPQPASAANNNTGTAPFDDTSGLATPPPVTGPTCMIYGVESIFPTPNCNPEDGEAQLDTESIAGLAPNAAVNFYLAFNNRDCLDNPGECPPGSIGIQGLYLTDDEIQQAIADNASDVLSLSYGMGENTAEGPNGYYDATGAGIGPDEFAALATEGIATFVSSGDNGNVACIDPSTGNPLSSPCVSYPAADPSVVGVGGVNIPLDEAGKLTGEIAVWGSAVWQGGNGTWGNNIGSGGGVSQFFPQPAYQQGVMTASNSNPASPQLNGHRGIPDIAMDADPYSGPSILMNGNFGGGYGASGGTSAAAPEAAAMWALVLQACKASASCATGTSTHPYRLGNPDFIFYQIYNGQNAMAYSQVIYDVLYGNNQANSPQGPPITGCCTAGTGYDLVTGVGSPFAGHLIKAATGTNIP
jgi:subtilase family serine protease